MLKLDKAFVWYAKQNKKTVIAIALLIIGILLIVFSSVGESGKGREDAADMTLDEYRNRTEEELRSLCSSVEGVGKCRVYVTFERGEQNVYKGSSVIETKPPRVLGVTVLCRGADSDFVRSELTEMICALFDIGSNRIAILKLNS